MDRLGAKLRSTRLQRKFSQSELAHRAGISLATLQNIEAGRANPEWQTIASLISALRLKITIDDQNIDWDQMANVGCPLLGSNDLSSSNPSPELLLETLQFLDKNCSRFEFTQRENLAITAWLAAIHDHFPSFWRRAPVSFHSAFLKKNPAISLKLRRLALTRLAQFL